MTTKLTGATVRRACVAAVACAVLLGAASSASAALPPIKHVFVLIDENESASTTFGAGSPAPYLSQTLVSEGAFLPNYYGVGHNSLDNYIAMVSGQAPNPTTSADCGTFSDFTSPSLDMNGQETGEGCVYPANVPSLMSQFDAAGLTWRAYEDSMGSDPSREAATCGHPAVGSPDNTQTETAADQYATRHDPFVYFHYVIDNAPECNANVVNLNQLPTDLASAATTPNFVFITPGLCDDGHDATCANGGPGGLGQADTFLRQWVPTITSSPAFKQNGLLIITFDEAAGSDTSDCCGEMPGPFEQMNGIPPGTGPGGGVVGAVLLSPFIAPGTHSTTPYNHFSMLGSVEDIFGLPRLADAVGTTAFGADVFTQPNGPPVITPPPPPAPVIATPRLTNAKVAPRALKSGKKAVVTFTLSESATVTATLARKESGVKLHKRCVAPPRHRKKGEKACTRLVTVTTFRASLNAGTGKFTIPAKIHGRKLAKGSYVVTLTATASGKSSTTTVSFTVK